jgi:hypothetical protein
MPVSPMWSLLLLLSHLLCINTIHLLSPSYRNTLFQESDANMTRTQKVKVVVGGLARAWKTLMRLPTRSKQIENFAAYD